MTETFHISARLDPTRSLLGRLVCRPDKDRLRAENLFYLAATGVVVVYLIAMFLGWAWINNSGPPAAEAATTFWRLQATGLFVVVLLAWLGIRPATRVEISPSGIHIRVGGHRTADVPAASIRSVARIPAIEFHQHHRQYRSTSSFIARPYPTVVVIEYQGGTLGLGVRPAEQNLLVSTVSALLPINVSESRVA